jgi:5'-3' exonuclease
MKKNLLIDVSNVYWRCAHVAHIEGMKAFKITSEIYSYWKNLTLQSILAVVNKKDWDKVIFCYDARGYWRHKIYPAYKANRAKNRDKSVIDFETFVIEINKFTADLKEKFDTVYHIEVEESEADDIAAVITEDLSNKGEYVMVMTSDKDYKQLIKFPNVEIYDPMKKKNMTSLNIKTEMEIKFVMGDKGDNIFAIKPKTGKVRAAAIVESGEIHMLQAQYHIDKTKLTEEQLEMCRKYELNRQLISFEYIPIDIKNRILTKFNSYELKRFDQAKMLIWLSENDLHDLSSRFLSNQSVVFMKLYDNYKNKLTNEMFF